MEFFDNVIVYKAEYSGAPHSEEEHELIATFDDKLKQLMKRKSNGGSNKNNLDVIH